MPTVVQKRQARLEELRTQRRTAKVETVKPTTSDGRQGNANYRKQIRHLRDLLDAASTQAGQVATQAHKLSAGDPMTNGPDGSPEWTKAQKAWGTLEGEMVTLGNDIHKMYQQVQKKA